MSTREDVAQREPDENLPWESFPRRTFRRDRVTLYRAVRKDRGAWWFCSCGLCRFDLRTPRGTCYVGTDPVCGVMESLGFQLCSGRLPVSRLKFIKEWTVCSVRPPRKLRAADLVTREAFAFRVTNELSSMTPYRLPQMFAALFDRIRDGRGRRRFHGISYRTRFDTGPTPHGLALFGDGGEKDWTTLKWRPIDDELLRSIYGAFPVAPPASIDQLDVVPLAT